MDFDWPDESLALRREAVGFGRSLNAGILEDDRTGRFPVEKWQRLAEWGYLGLRAPAQFGGGGLDPMTGLLVTEGLGEGCEDGGLVFSGVVQAWVLVPGLLTYGTEAQKQRYLPGLADGTTIGALAITEPDTGSDAFAMRTRATAVEGGWSLAGRKAYVTNGPAANLVICFAATGEGGAMGGISVFLVETDTPGVERTQPMAKMGLRTSPLGDLVFDDAFIPEENALGEIGSGALIFNELLEWERVWATAAQIGALQRDLEQDRSYAKQRKAFGAPIASYQAVANRIVDMKVRLEAGRLLVYRAAWLKAQDQSALAESALAKLWVTEGAVESSLDSIQVHGGYGYMSEAGIERRLRDAVAGRIYSGTSEMQRAILGRSIGL
ncbi:MAG TPA: acyl-CoA dehydrogenase family protein [Solirubrobacterales bacterium]|nr:acyl-CoA dehydrogenase family protein [Solirubrobacterales bacterium]